MKLTQHPAGGRAPGNQWPGRSAARGCLLGLCLALVAAGCATRPPAATGAPISAAATSAPDECPPEKVSVIQVRSFQDSLGAWRIVGMIDNGWDHAVSKIVTAVEALDSAGKVIDHGEDISAYPLNLQPGTRMPFIGWIKRDFPGVDHFRVVVDQCIVAEKLDRSSVEVRGGRLSFDDAGRGQVTAELVNPSDRPALVNGMIAALFDTTGAPLAAGDASVAARYLAPGEHGPVRVTLDLPPGGRALASTYRLFMDPIVSEARPAPLDAHQDLRVTSRYSDAGGRFHLAGEVTNRSRQSITLRLQATLYDDAARSNVLDAAFFDTPLPLAPGETRPFDFVDWGAVNAQVGLADQLVRHDAAEEVRVEPFQSWTGGAVPVVVALLNTSSRLTGQEVAWTGKIRNDAGRPITDALVTAVAREHQDGQLLATAGATINVAGGWPPGEVRDFALTIPLWPGFRPQDVDFAVTALAR